MVVHRCARCFGGVAVMHTSIDSDLDMIFGMMRETGAVVRFGVGLRRRLLRLDHGHGKVAKETEERGYRWVTIV
jgi:hypothetical protein